jgi:hypothetical protein
MHVKCIHELYSLLDHITNNLIDEDLDLFAIDPRGFLNNPLSFGFNTLKQISLFLHVFDFQDLPDVKRTQTFCHIIFWK